MKTGRTLTELALEIERQATSKRDFVASTKEIAVVANEGRGPSLIIGDEIDVGITAVAHRQIAEHTGIPTKYYDRMVTEAPELMARNVNTWLRQNPTPRMVRTLDGKARAFLSDRYRPLENADLAEAVLPVLLGLEMEVMSCEITDRKLYIKAVHTSVRKDMPVKSRRWGDGSHDIFDTFSPGIVVSNSEVGLGALSVDTGIFTKLCTNLAVFKQEGLRKAHLGARHDVGDQLYALLSDDTRRVTDAATWMQVRDYVKGALDETMFKARIKKLEALTDQPLEGDVQKVVEVTSKSFGLNDDERGGVLRHLIEGGDLSRYGLFNAITRTAQDVRDYDRATEMEAMGGRFVELAANDWREIAKQAA